MGGHGGDQYSNGKLQSSGKAMSPQPKMYSSAQNWLSTQKITDNQRKAEQQEGFDQRLNTYYQRQYEKDYVKLYSNREQRGHCFFAENPRKLNIEDNILQYPIPHAKSRFQQECHRDTVNMEASVRLNELPAAVHFLKTAKNSHIRSNSLGVKNAVLRKVLPTIIPYEKKYMVTQKQDTLLKNQTKIEAAGYGNFGPQPYPQNVPHQTAIYFYKR